ncbi:hypothetical protein [Saccharothrix luteola]|uniref:hypothetical protein n=1 Tax=Saccharothrix luteola TaxID=2893018 RepID=UPI001E50D665|nr:hypothetical protein [Saccharothrix luteola]MCC8249796.1 hypothetical protein [Saccharothrix luteola]
MAGPTPPPGHGQLLAPPPPRRYFALNGTDHHSHDEQNTAIAAYIRWRNTRARPKTGFATDSPIRTWTHYAIKVA